jgi:hypothetical protein
LLNPRPTHPPSDFFWAFLVKVKGSSKTPQTYFGKSPCRKLSPKFRPKFRCQFFLDFFCFIAFSGVFQRWEFKSTTKNVLQKKSSRKVFTKKSTKSPKPIFSRFFVYHVFGRFSVRGGQKHDKKYRKNKSDASPFLASDPPTHHGGHRFLFYWRPLGLAKTDSDAPRSQISGVPGGPAARSQQARSSRGGQYTILKAHGAPDTIWAAPRHRRAKRAGSCQTRAPKNSQAEARSW